MNTRVVSTILIFLSATSLLYAQDLKSALITMQQVYANAKKLHIVMEVKVFETSSDTEPLLFEKADIKKEKNNYCYRFASTEMLLNEKYQIVVDKESKDIIINKRDQKIEVQYKDMFKASLDSILSFYNAPEHIGDSVGITHYRVFQKQGVVDQIDLHIDMKTSVLKKMQYHYREGQFVSIVFETFDTAPSFEEDAFDDKNYILVANGRIKPSARLQQYRIFGVDDK